MFDTGCDRQRASAPSSTRWIAWMPLLFVAAFLYWSVALGLGGLSLMAASAISSGAESAPDFAASAVEPVSGHAVAEPIVVRLEESAEPEDVNDNAWRLYEKRGYGVRATRPMVRGGNAHGRDWLLMVKD